VISKRNPILCGLCIFFLCLWCLWLLWKFLTKLLYWQSYCQSRLKVIYLLDYNFLFIYLFFSVGYCDVYGCCEESFIEKFTLLLCWQSCTGQSKLMANIIYLTRTFLLFYCIILCSILWCLWIQISSTLLLQPQEVTSFVK
jgi:hypothetical protein